jgi:hypothetical protein
MSNAPKAAPTAGAGNSLFNIANVFAELTGSGNPMARLKKTVTKESAPLGYTKPKELEP